MSAPQDIDALRRELSREHERLHALRDVSAAVGSSLDINDLVETVLSKVAVVLDADRTTFYLLDDDGQHLRARVRGDEDDLEIRLPIGEGLAGSCARDGQVINIVDAYDDPRFDRSWDGKTGYRTKSILCVPLKNQNGRVVGVLQALNKRSTDAFGDEDEGLMGALGAQIAVAIENSKLFLSVVGKNMELLEAKEQLETKVRELDVLFEIATVSATATALDEVLEGVLRHVTRAVDAMAASILIEGRHRSELRFRLADQPIGTIRAVKIEPGEGVSGWVAQNGQPFRSNAVRQDPNYSPSIATQLGYGPRMVLAVPLRWDDGAGALTVFDKARGRDPFTEDDVKLATVIAGHVSNAIALTRARIRRAQEERLSTIGQFMSGVLHDLKTPMTVINGYVKLMADEPDPERRKRMAEVAAGQVQLIKVMTQETLAFARGDRKLWIRKTYVAPFFEELAEQLRRSYDGKSIDVVLELHDRGIVYFDPHKVQRAIHNLARNASEAILSQPEPHEPGRVVLSVARRSDDGSLLVSFSDNGPGIPEAIRGRVFESFATHGKSKGTG
ncbi:MAG: GAF domain-containing sensor histidine kinase, partial [Myxococcales bacterium]|nr:GAF domain-containing sensor histidine kinase [Myxococcales bacterium]